VSGHRLSVHRFPYHDPIVGIRRRFMDTRSLPVAQPVVKCHVSRGKCLQIGSYIQSWSIACIETSLLLATVRSRRISPLQFKTRLPEAHRRALRQLFYI
jgi:hypothetical protein